MLRVVVVMWFFSPGFGSFNSLCSNRRSEGEVEAAPAKGLMGADREHRGYCQTQSLSPLLISNSLSV